MCYRALLALLLTAVLSGQTMVEYGGISGHSAGTAAGIGKSVNGVFGKVNQSLGGAATQTNLTAKPGAQAAAPAKEAEPVLSTPVDWSGLAAGMDRADMVKKAGKPAMSFSMLESSTMVETCSYRNGAETVTVILRDGKVASIAGLDKSAAH